MSWLAPLRLDWQLAARAPLGPGAGVESLRWFAERIERKPERGGGDAGAATRDDGLVEIDAASGKRGAQARERQQRAILHQLGRGHIEGARHVAGAQPRP